MSHYTRIAEKIEAIDLINTGVKGGGVVVERTRLCECGVRVLAD